MTNGERAHDLAMAVAHMAASKGLDPVKAYLAAFNAVIRDGVVGVGGDCIGKKDAG